MNSRRLLNLICAVLCTILHLELTASACSTGWFGSKCQYLCHCDAGGSCDANGQCSTKCAAGWFGHGCQYQDLADIIGVTISTTPSQTSTTWLRDNDDRTCNADQRLQSLNITLHAESPLTWLRVKVNDSNDKLDFAFAFINSTNADNYNIISCNPLILSIDDTTVDYRCNFTVGIRQILVTGNGLKSLCSFYISGGRNVALKQAAAQTSIWPPNYNAFLAVDGNTNYHFDSGTCMHTYPGDRNPSWTLTFDSPRSVNRIVLYNRGDCCMERLKNFKLEIFNSNNFKLLNYTDRRETNLIYALNITGENSIRKIRISPTTRNALDGMFYLALCEVELYGECVSGMWGLDCKGTCPPGCPSWCQKDTGQCPSCLGFSYPPACENECSNDHWGHNCENVCGKNCYNESCNRITGVCDKGCHGYSNPPDCDAECLNGFWGYNCENKCGDNCYDNSCNKLTGDCDQGCGGFSNPPECTEECPDYRWGNNCKEKCGANCYNETCHSKTGVCVSGCNGYSNPPECNISVKDWSLESSTGIATGTLVVIVICILVAFGVYRAKRKNLSSSCNPHNKTMSDTAVHFCNKSVGLNNEYQPLTVDHRNSSSEKIMDNGPGDSLTELTA